VAVDTAAGAVSGAVTATLGPIGAGVGGAIITGVMHVGVGAALGAGTQVDSNIATGKPLGDGVLLAAGIGGLAGLVTSPGVAQVLGRVAGKAGGALAKVFRGACGESFSPDTPVATPSGEQAIGSLQIGDQVTAYDPSSGKTSAQTVQQVYVNHDTDLLDVTLAPDTAQPQTGADGRGKKRDAEVAAHGLRAPPRLRSGRRRRVRRAVYHLSSARHLLSCHSAASALGRRSARVTVRRVGFPLVAVSSAYAGERHNTQWVSGD